MLWALTIASQLHASPINPLINALLNWKNSQEILQSHVIVSVKLSMIILLSSELLNCKVITTIQRLGLILSVLASLEAVLAQQLIRLPAISNLKLAFVVLPWTHSIWTLELKTIFVTVLTSQGHWTTSEVESDMTKSSKTFVLKLIHGNSMTTRAHMSAWERMSQWRSSFAEGDLSSRLLKYK